MLQGRPRQGAFDVPRVVGLVVALRIAFLSLQNARDPRSWSGTPYFTAVSLAERGAEVMHVGPLPVWPMKAMRARRKLERRLGIAQSMPGASLAWSRLCGRLARAGIDRLPTRPDVLFAPAGSVLIANLVTDIPVVYLSDATVRLMLDYYPEFTGLSKQAIQTADALEQAAIARAALLVYPTRWAADSAINDYGADPGKIVVAPLGANFLEDEIDRAGSPPDDGVCRLLFVGADWQRKGGAIALNTVRYLQALGVPCRLTVVGTHPPRRVNSAETEFVGYLDKNRPVDRARLNALYREAHFFLLPTRNECYGIVFCEAAAYGLPVLATRTGGVPDVVSEGENGFTLPPEDEGEGYAARIAEIWADRERYRALREGSRRMFETRLNWFAWSGAVLDAMERVAGRSVPAGEPISGPDRRKGVR
jgi:glycosyltransferase involved in cell wall biosynthesis